MARKSDKTLPTEFRMPKGRMYLNELFKFIGTVHPDSRPLVLNQYIAKGDDHEKVLRSFIECVYHPRVLFDLPEGAPPYKKADAADPSMAFTTLFKEMKMVTYWAECPTKIQNDMKRESLFVRSLENLHCEEAEILIAMKDKKLPKYRGLSKTLLQANFPQWFHNPTTADDAAAAEDTDSKK